MKNKKEKIKKEKEISVDEKIDGLIKSLNQIFEGFNARLTAVETHCHGHVIETII